MPQLVFNAPQLHLESLAAAAAVPAPFGHLGPFWWASQYTWRLLRPAPHLRNLLQLALRRSGLGAALAAGPVVGVHVRHGDSCLSAEASRTARTCEPFARYLDAAAPYLAALSVLGGTAFAYLYVF